MVAVVALKGGSRGMFGWPRSSPVAPSPRLRKSGAREVDSGDSSQRRQSLTPRRRNPSPPGLLPAVKDPSAAPTRLLLEVAEKGQALCGSLCSRPQQALHRCWSPQRLPAGGCPQYEMAFRATAGLCQHAGHAAAADYQRQRAGTEPEGVTLPELTARTQTSRASRGVFSFSGPTMAP